MCADSATSVSKGCFVYHGKRKRMCEMDYVKTTEKFAKPGFKMFQESWDQLEMQIDILKSDLNCQIFDDLVTFLKTCHKDAGSDYGRPTEEIPTAVLLTGVNTPDHRVMFASLQSLLKDNVTPYVISLLSQDCSRVSSLIQVVISRLTNMDVGDHDETMDEETQNHENSSFQFKSVTKGTSAISMVTLVKWYEAIVCDAQVKSKQHSSFVNDMDCNSDEKSGSNDSTGSKPLIVIMFEDLENIPAKAIQDFISICSSYMIHLPIVFVMGVATSMSAVHQLLPSSVSSLLCMEKFQAPPASQYLTQLMDKIIMTADVPFKLGPKVFHFLLDIFLYHNFSIMNFTLGFQYCMMEHFLTNSLSFLCVGYDDIDKVTQSLSRGQLQHIKQHPAFQQYLTETSNETPKCSTVLDTHTRMLLASALKSFHTYHFEMFVMIRFLHSLTSGLPKQPLGRQLREIYSICLKQNITETEDFAHAFQLLKMMSRHDLTEILTQSLPTLEDAKEKSFNLKDVHYEVELLIYRLVNLNEEENMEDEANDDDDTASGNIRTLPMRAKLHELKQTLLSMPSKRKLSPYERQRNEILSVLQDYFKRFLICPLNKPLYEIFYFNDLAQVKDHFKAVPRCSIQRALTQPNKHLTCACCECDVDEILPSMPDVCIVYKLHLECGTLVNLFDWMQAFITVVSQDDQQGKRRKHQTQKPESQLRARFIRAVSELQFLGFIKSTRRKTDHVERLTW